MIDMYRLFNLNMLFVYNSYCIDTYAGFSLGNR